MSDSIYNEFGKLFKQHFMNNNEQPITNPTFYQNIKPMFCQLDRVMMLSVPGTSFDLFDYHDVMSNAKKIMEVVKPGSRNPMPQIGGPWPASLVQTFQNWITAGCPAGVDPSPPVSPVDPGILTAFIALSKALTGIDQFFHFNTNPAIIKQQEEALAKIYYNRLLKRPANGSDPNNTITGVLTAWGTNQDASALARQFHICKDIIILWYNTTTNWDADGNTVSIPSYGTPAFNQYIQGQLWKVALIHPVGFAPEVMQPPAPTYYWQNKPMATGENSGFYYVNY